MNISTRLLRPLVPAVCAAVSMIGVASAAAPDDPCATIPASVVAGVLGTPVVKTVPRDAGVAKSCAYRSAHFMPYASISAFRDGRSDADPDFRNQVAGLASQTGMPATHVAGIGDDAVDVAGLLYVRKGTAIYTFSVTDGKATAGDLAKREQLAKAALPHVKG